MGPGSYGRGNGERFGESDAHLRRMFGRWRLNIRSRTPSPIEDLCKTSIPSPRPLEPGPTRLCTCRSNSGNMIGSRLGLTAVRDDGERTFDTQRSPLGEGWGEGVMPLDDLMLVKEFPDETVWLTDRL